MALQMLCVFLYRGRLEKISEHRLACSVPLYMTYSKKPLIIAGLALAVLILYGCRRGTPEKSTVGESD